MGAYERVPLSVSSPAGKSVCAGASVSLSVTASGQATLSYRWRKGGSNLADGGAISGSGTDTLTIDPAATGDSGSYDVVVTDGFGQMKTSTAAALTVSAVPSAPAPTAPEVRRRRRDRRRRERARSLRIDLCVDALRRDDHVGTRHAPDRILGGRRRARR